MPSEVYLRSFKRFCKNGHDKSLFHNYAYIHKRGWIECGICARAKAKRQNQEKRNRQGLKSSTD